MKKINLTILLALWQLLLSGGDLLSKERLHIVFIFSDDHSFEAISAFTSFWINSFVSFVGLLLDVFS